MTLVDRYNHHLFQPLLYQVAAGGLSSSDCASPDPSVCQARGPYQVPDGRGHRCRGRAPPGRARQRRSARVRQPDRRLWRRASYFGHEEWQEVTCALKTLKDAIALRERFYGAFEEAERCEDPAQRSEWLTFVVVGGGPTGVEVAGQLAITANSMKPDFRRIDPTSARVILLDAGDRVVAAFSEKLSGKVTSQLHKLGVIVREGARATMIDAHGVTIEVGGESERIDARTVIWAAGVCSVGLVERIAHSSKASTDRAGRIEVGADLTVPGHPEISVIGDVACVAGKDGRPLPGLATVAIQQARHVAKAIRQGQPGSSVPFRYFDKGALAVVGRGQAVCEIRGMELSGRIAFFTYLSVHLYYLGGAPGRRLEVLIKWIGSRFGERQSARSRASCRSPRRSRRAWRPCPAPRLLAGAGPAHW